MDLRRLVPVALLLAAPLVAACGSSGVSGSTATSSTQGGAAPADDLGEPVDMTGKAEVTIEAVDNAYEPRAVKVSPGTKVTWKNTGANAHNVTPRDDGGFPPFQDLPEDKSATVTFDKAGTFLYYCTIHSAKDRGPQRGKVVVG